MKAHQARPWTRIDLTGGQPPVELAASRPLPRSLAVHPTQLYSTIDALALCLLLLTLHPFCRRDGQLTAIMLTIYPVSRFLVETLRTDEPNILGTGMHISQNISLGVLACAIGLWCYVLRQPARQGGVTLPS